MRRPPRVLIGLVSLLVPRVERGRWREEWLGEIAQVAADRGARAAWQVARGAGRDALAMRRVVRARAAGGNGFLARRVSAMDFKLGVRMLVRYPGLTTVAVLGLAVGIMISAGTFSILYTLTAAALPLDEGDRIITIQNVDTTTGRPDRRILHDLDDWRASLASVQDLGAFRQVGRNLIFEGTGTEPVTVAEISASAFRVARVPAFMGRHLLDGDEHPGAAPVLVIGYAAWRTRFRADPSVVGRSVLLGDTLHAVVGVMPEGFEFPVSHQFWVPLKPNAAAIPRRAGPALTAFGRLAPGAALERAQVELSELGRRSALAFPQTHEHLRPRILPYTYPFFDIDDPSMLWLIHLAQFLISLLLVIISVNVAILVFARTARRHGEMAVRSALGASRGRIVSQLFVEGLALAVVAAAIGLWLTGVGLAYVNTLMQQAFGQRPFWWRFGLTPGVVAWVVGLTVLSAAIIGLIPALKATGRRLQSGLQAISAGGGSSMRMGRTWTVLIIAQVGIAVALLPAAVFHAWDALRQGTADPGFAAHEFLAAEIGLDFASATAPTTSAERTARYAARMADVIERLRVEPTVSAIAAATSLADDGVAMVIEAEGVAHSETPVNYNIPEGSRLGHLAHFNRIDVDYFRTFGMPLLAGRAFASADTSASSTAIVVNRTLAERLFGGAALGRRVRYVGRGSDSRAQQVQLERWYEIVGVVPDFPAITASGYPEAKIYHALDIQRTAPISLAIRIRGDATAFAPRLRDIAAAVDPNLQLWHIVTIDQLLRKDQSMIRLIAGVLAVLTLSVVLLSSGGIYSMLSFTVAHRKKEIGIRTALGAEPRQILRSIFARVLWQLALGATLGVGIAALLEFATDGGLMQGHGTVVLPIVAVLMMLVGLAATVGPARGALRVQPTDALRVDG